MAKFKVGDEVSVSGKDNLNRFVVTDTRMVNSHWMVSPQPIYQCRGLIDPYAPLAWWAEGALSLCAPAKYRVVLETENPDQFKMLNGSTFVSSEAIR